MLLAKVTTVVCEGREEVAIVIKDHGNGTVNLLVIDSDGRTRPEFNYPVEALRAEAALPVVVVDPADAEDEEDRE